ncbi:ATPase [Modicisalibacter tunisiensis]|uniref:ATPase n=1 Tax=Modicisalibacter tunisiensis TaxID=390637 RepID=UPI0007965420|nr:ATPase [Modicisalibacter tunisiensis]KXS37529.1 MAG: V-type H+-transporting ATPase subunit E [Halomonadaceae bacterium T82-2]MBZ9539542.1 ATPase [Modicisalibacter tunisiensis]
MSTPSQPDSHGIQALLDTLREQGVEAGQQEATRLVEEAEQRAAWLVDQAREEAARLTREAEEEAERLREAGRQALTLAYRDLCLTARDTFSQQFAGELETLIHDTLDDPELLARLIQEAARRAPLPEDARGEALLPSRVVGIDELRENPEALHEGALPALLARVARAMLERGIVLKGDDAVEAGVRFVLDDGHIHVDLSDRAIAGLLLRHLQPRFRALLEGVIA